MSSPKLLLTGASGFIGFHVLLKALEEGWFVRAAVRSISKPGSLANHPKTRDSVESGRLSFVEVPDICDENAYEQAIKGVTHVIHLASPLPSPLLDPLTGIYEPNINSVKAILRAAVKEPSLKKLVITSSIFGNTPFPPNLSQHITPEFSSQLARTVQHYDACLLGIVFPGFVFGKDERALKLEDFASSTNRIMLGVITGQASGSQLPAGATHVDDTAKIYMLALKDGAPRNIGSTVPHVFDEAWDIVAKHFPKAVETGVFTKGSQPTIPVNWDASQTERDFNIKFKTWEEMVVDAAGQYLELSGEEKV